MGGGHKQWGSSLNYFSKKKVNSLFFLPIDKIGWSWVKDCLYRVSAGQAGRKERHTTGRASKVASPPLVLFKGYSFPQHSKLRSMVPALQNHEWRDAHVVLLVSHLLAALPVLLRSVPVVLRGPPYCNTPGYPHQLVMSSKVMAVKAGQRGLCLWS